MGWVRTAIRIQRFEVVAAVVIATILAISGVVVWYRLGAVGVPHECWATWATSGFMDTPAPCGSLLFAFGLINGEDAARTCRDGRGPVPFSASCSGCLSSRARSRRERPPCLVAGSVSTPLVRWSATAILTLLIVAAVALWAMSDLVWSAREPWQPILNLATRRSRFRRRRKSRSSRWPWAWSSGLWWAGRCLPFWSRWRRRAHRLREHHLDGCLVHD